MGRKSFSLFESVNGLSIYVIPIHRRRSILCWKLTGRLIFLMISYRNSHLTDDNLEHKGHRWLFITWIVYFMFFSTIFKVKVKYHICGGLLMVVGYFIADYRVKFQIYKRDATFTRWTIFSCWILLSLLVSCEIVTGMFYQAGTMKAVRSKVR